MMPAAKHFDPVIGVDVHIIQPPGPVPPIPVPHPFVGILFDAFDWVPILGATIMVNGVPRAVAGTSGKTAAGIHFPIGGTFIKPPSNECEMFMGSTTVNFEGQPASYMALPALSCQDIGMAAPFRSGPKKKTKMKSLVLPTSVVLPIPAGLPVLIGGAPTISMAAIGMKLGMTALGKAFKKIAKSKLAQRAADKFKKARQKLFRNTKPGFIKCKILRAEPIDIVTGEVVLEQQDFTIYGRIPIEWTRRYNSHNTRTGVCGYGWETPADARLVFAEDGAVIFYDGNAGSTVFSSLPYGEPVIDLVDGSILDQTGYELIVRIKSGFTFYFRKPENSAKEVLVERIVDRNGNFLQYIRNDDGLQEISESAGRRIKVISRNGLIINMHLEHPDLFYQSRLVGYEYDSVDDLIIAYDSLSAPYRFVYIDHYLIRHTDRNGFSFYYKYDDSVLIRKCVHTFGDEGLYEYRFDYSESTNETRITDSLGNTSIVQFNSNLLPIKEIDPLGGTTTYEYDEAGRTSVVIDAEGDRLEYQYDIRGNLIRLLRPDGVDILADYDQDNRLARLVDPNGNVWQYKWDEQYLPLKRINPNGAITQYQHDVYGNLSSITNPRGATTYFKTDRYGNTTDIINALGNKIHLTFDLFGKVISRIDPLGNRTAFEYDTKSRLIGIVFPNGTKIIQEYDPEDNLISFKDKDGLYTVFEYTGIGQIASIYQPDGAIITYRYDTEGRVICVTNQSGQSFQIRRNSLGQITKEVDYWGQSRTYQYSSAGHILESRDALGRVTKYNTDSLGRIKSVLLPDGTTEEFSYDRLGNIIRSSNKDTMIERIFDFAGNILEERIGDFKVTNAYDINGNRIRRKTSFGNDIIYKYDLLDQVIEICINNGFPLKIERNAIGQPILETLSPELHRIYHYDDYGRMTYQGIFSHTCNSFNYNYVYDILDNLIERTDSRYGTDTFHYDLMSRIVVHKNQGGKIKENIYDAAGNLFNLFSNNGREGSTDQKYFGGQIDSFYHFDVNGNLIERSDSSARYIFKWDFNNHLVSSKKEAGSTTTYGYDAHGRRTFKETDGNRIRFYWDDTAILADRFPDGKFREFVYYPETFEPLAIIYPGNQVYYYHNDLNGLPRDLSDNQGKIYWSSSYDSFGGTTEILINNIENPIRLQGQYYDIESNLSYNLNRYYDSQIGCFISHDPLLLNAGENLYRFAPNIWSWIDPLGLSCVNHTPNTGVIYLRRLVRKDGNGNVVEVVEEYVGKSKSTEAFTIRRLAHEAKLGKMQKDPNSIYHLYPGHEYEFIELQKGLPGTANPGDLAKAEEDWIRAGGGPKLLANKRYEANQSRYALLGGTVPK